MDLDQIMTKIYVPHTNRRTRLSTALAQYTDCRNQYGNNSPEAQSLYAVLVGIFPEMERYSQVIDSIEVGIAKGKFKLLPGDQESLRSQE